MFRAMAIVATLGLFLCGTTAADAAQYCAAYVGGQGMKRARSHCNFASLAACRESIRSSGGGHCYKMGQMH